MNFDADSGIKRRMIAMEFNSIFAEAEDLEDKRATYPNSDVFQIDRNLLDMFKIMLNIKTRSCISLFNNQEHILIMV